jgi:hypothetical protein
MNQPFIEDAHFENTMTNDPEILLGSKKNIPNAPKTFLFYFNELGSQIFFLMKAHL